jgi:hypothetical protein
MENKLNLFGNPTENISFPLEEFLTVSKTFITEKVPLSEIGGTSEIKIPSMSEEEHFLEELKFLWNAEEKQWLNNRNKVRITFIRNYSYYNTIAPVVGLATNHYFKVKNKAPKIYIHFHTTGTTLVLVSYKHKRVLVDKIHTSILILENILEDKLSIKTTLETELSLFLQNIETSYDGCMTAFVTGKLSNSCQYSKERHQKVNTTLGSIFKNTLKYELYPPPSNIATSFCMFDNDRTENMLLGTRELNLAHNINVVASATLNMNRDNKCHIWSVHIPEPVKWWDYDFSHYPPHYMMSGTRYGLESGRKCFLNLVENSDNSVIIADFNIFEKLITTKVGKYILGKNYELVLEVDRMSTSLSKMVSDDSLGNLPNKSLYIEVFNKSQPSLEELFSKEQSELLGMYTTLHKILGSMCLDRYT